jgi:hypothetical protein
MKETTKIILAFILGILICGAVVCASTLLKASDVSYNDTTVNDALNELFDLANKKGPTKVDATSTDTHKGIVYLDPTDLTRYCDAENSVSTTGLKIWCMKWYIFAEDDDSYTVILDHNTTALVAWNKSGSNSSMNEVATALTNDTSSWDSSIKATARLITADEIATITGNTTFNSSTSTTSNYFYFETNTTTAQNPHSGTYAWLYDYTSGCLSYGCNVADSSNNGYWTSTPVARSTNLAWFVYFDGCFHNDRIDYAGILGVRPVITISKDLFE